MDTDWPLIAVRFALYVTLSGLFGLSAFSLYGLKAGERADAIALRPWLVGSGLLALLFSGIALALLAAAMAGAPPWPVDQEAIGMLLSGSATGTAWEARVAALWVASIAALVAAGRPVLLGLVAFAAAVALATLAWTGHGAMDEGTIGWVHLGAGKQVERGRERCLGLGFSSPGRSAASTPPIWRSRTAPCTGLAWWAR